MKDPLKPSRGAARRGSAGLGRRTPGDVIRWELGTVLAYNSATHTSDVRTLSGRPLKNVPQIKSTAGSYDHIPAGTTVVVSWDLGIPAIMGCMDLPGAALPATQGLSLTGVEGVGSADPTQATHGSNNYKPATAPTDLGPGDWAHVGAMGNHVAILEGGLSLLGSATAQIQSLGATGTLRTIARRVEQFTDFGQLRIENDQGKTSLVLRAGSNQTTETGVDAQHWTIRLDLGATGDVLDLRIVEPQGKTLFRLHVGPDGHVQLYGDAGVDISAGATGAGILQHDVAGSRATRIERDDTVTVRGAHQLTVDGDVTLAHNNDHVMAIGGHATMTVGKNLVSLVQGDVSAITQGHANHINQGDRTTAILGAEQLTVDGNLTLNAKQQTIIEGRKVALGKHAQQPVIRGTDFQTRVIAQLSSAGTALTVASTGASAIMATPLTPPSVTTPLALTAVIAGMSALGSALVAIASSYPSTLSTKVSVE